ncbi:hypothetical protein ACHAWF_000188 [Thalassiosira exigua]
MISFRKGGGGGLSSVANGGPSGLRSPLDTSFDGSAEISSPDSILDADMKYFRESGSGGGLSSAAQRVLKGSGKTITSEATSDANTKSFREGGRGAGSGFQ